MPFFNALRDPHCDDARRDKQQPEEQGDDGKRRPPNSMPCARQLATPAHEQPLAAKNTEACPGMSVHAHQLF